MIINKFHERKKRKLLPKVIPSLCACTHSYRCTFSAFTHYSHVHYLNNKQINQNVAWVLMYPGIKFSQYFVFTSGIQ